MSFSSGDPDPELPVARSGLCRWNDNSTGKDGKKLYALPWRRAEIIARTEHKPKVAGSPRRHVEHGVLPDICRVREATIEVNPHSVLTAPGCDLEPVLMAWEIKATIDIGLGIKAALC